MRPVPVPDGMAEAMGGDRVPVGDDVDCECIALKDRHGDPVFVVLLALDEIDRAAIQDGAGLFLVLGEKVSFRVDVGHFSGSDR